MNVARATSREVGIRGEALRQAHLALEVECEAEFLRGGADGFEGGGVDQAIPSMASVREARASLR